jgi:hypothetical protein
VCRSEARDNCSRASNALRPLSAVRATRARVIASLADEALLISLHSRSASDWLSSRRRFCRTGPMLHITIHRCARRRATGMP